jgi:hypothetical protein
MALNLGQLITGGAAFSRGQRAAEEAERVSRQNQLALEQLNRQDRLRQEMLQAPIGEQTGGLQLPGALEAVPPRFDAQLTAAPTPAPAPAPAAATTEAPAPAPTATAPAADQYEALYERVKGLKRKGVTGRLTYTRDLNVLTDKAAFSDDDIARIYAIALNKADSSTADALRGILTQRGVDPKYLREVARQSRQAQRALAGVRKEEQQQASADEERRRLFELKTGRKVGTATTSEVITPGAVATADGLKANDAIQRVIQREGGYVNDPDDVGGETKFGISKNAYPKLDIANLTEAEAARIYKRDYWDRIEADKLPANIREMAFDAAVNQGVGWTRKALQDSGNDPQQFLQLRAQRYQDIVANNPNQEKFLQGWLNRLGEFAGGVVEAVIPTAEAAPAAAPAPAAGVAPTMPPAGTAPPAVLSNMQNVPFEMQRSMQQREEAVRLARMYQRAGMGEEFMQARAKVLELDNNMLYMQGMQGIQEFGLTKDPRRLSAVWSAYYGAQIGVQPRTDGRYNILVDGQVAREGVSANEMTQMARLSFDTGYRQQTAEAGAAANLETFKAQLKIQEEQGKQTAQMIREIAVAQTQGNINQALEWYKVNVGWDIKPSGAGDGTVIIRPPGGAPYLFNPSGRTIEIDGVKVQTNAAYPIAGLPSFGGLKPR